MDESYNSHKAKSFFLNLAGYILLPCAFIGYFVTRCYHGDIGVSYLLGALDGAIGCIGMMCINRARRHDAVCMSHTLKNDPRFPIVYLRPFSEDRKTDHPLGTWLTMQTRSEEEQLIHVFKDVGPVIAIGDPREKLPTLGAERTYFRNDKWQSEVLEMLGKAQFVILRAGTSKGFLWEIEMVVKLVRPEQIIILTGKKKNEYEEFCQQINNRLPQPLPAYVKSKIRQGTTRGFVYFTKEWTPVFKPLISEGMFRISRKYPMAPIFNASFKPVFEQLQIPWKRQEMSAIAFIPWVMLLFFSVVFICWAVSS